MKANLEDPHYGIVSAVAKGIPSQIDYINENWSQYDVVREYCEVAYDAALRTGG